MAAPTPTLAAHPNPTAPVLSQFSLKGKTALVTGGTRGIGLEVSRGLAEAGANVAILYTSTSPSAAEATAASIASSTGVNVKAYKANVVNQAEIESVMEKVTEELGGGVLDIVVANAGIATHFPAENYTVEQWKEIMDVNLNGAFYTAQAAGRIFKRQWGEEGKAKGGKRGQGSLVFTGSVSAVLVNVPQKQSAYNASKAAVVQLARCLSVEWVGWCRVNVVSPVSFASFPCCLSMQFFW